MIVTYWEPFCELMPICKRVYPNVETGWVDEEPEAHGGYNKDIKKNSDTFKGSGKNLVFTLTPEELT